MSYLSSTSLLETKGNVLRQLTTNRNDNAAGSFHFIYIHHTLKAQLLKVELVGSVEIGAVSLRVVG
jgi:hypothetical protein